MAPRKKFDEQSVIDAVKQLETAGKTVTANALRTVIGSGRPSALWDMYQNLLESGALTVTANEQQEVAVVESYELPSEVREELEIGLNAFKSLVIKCNDIANHTVEKRLNSAIEKAKKAELESIKKAEDAEKQAELAFNEAEEKQEELEIIQEELTNANARCTEIEKEKIKLETLIGALREELSNAQKAADSLNELQEEITLKDKKIIELETRVGFIESASNGMTSALKKAQEEREEATKALAKAEGKIEILESQSIDNDNIKKPVITGELKKDPASHQSKSRSGGVTMRWLVNDISIISSSNNDNPEIDEIDVQIANTEHEYIKSMSISNELISDIREQHKSNAPHIKIR